MVDDTYMINIVIHKPPAKESLPIYIWSQVWLIKPVENQIDMLVLLSGSRFTDTFLRGASLQEVSWPGVTAYSRSEENF